MKRYALEVGNLDGLVFLIGLIMIGPAVVFAIIGVILSGNKKPKAAKVFYILAGVYLLISFGTCGFLAGGF
tara:strand:+ start:77647 stop:77859 length:213 start_codon:yes stop_codon:yes gene_type:complete